MIPSELISNRTLPADAFVVRQSPAQDSFLPSAPPDRNACRVQIDRLVEQINCATLREVVGTVFQDLLRLLDCLSLIESHLPQIRAGHENFAFFQLIQDGARLLVKFIHTDVLNREGQPEELVDTLDGITFAITHDLRRAFEENAGSGDSDTMTGAVSSKLYRAHDVLTKCLQESTVSLAVSFDPELTAARLFNNSDTRYRQSLQLCQDLQELVEIVEHFEEGRVEPALSKVVAAIEKFRSKSMGLLMQADWPHFEGFCESIKLSKTDLRLLEPVIHQFRCYLETLLGQVRMRTVLADTFPIRFGEVEDGQVQTPTNERFNSSSSVIDFRDEEQIWSTLAVAV